MKAQEIRNMSAEDLGKSLSDLLKEQFKLRMLQANSQLTKHDKIKKVRRDVARIRTILTEKLTSEAKSGDVK